MTLHTCDGRRCLRLIFSLERSNMRSRKVPTWLHILAVLPNQTLADTLRSMWVKTAGEFVVFFPLFLFLSAHAQPTCECLPFFQFARRLGKPASAGNSTHEATIVLSCDVRSLHLSCYSFFFKKKTRCCCRNCHLGQSARLRRCERTHSAEFLTQTSF